MKTKLFLLFLLLAGQAFGTISVTGSLQDLTGTAVTSGTFVRFYMRGCNGNQPFVSGVALIAPTIGATWFKDLLPNGSGAVSGTLYSTTDVSCGGSTSVIWYGMVVFVNGKAGPESAVSAAGNININNPTLITSAPVVPVPTGDTTYLRLDGSNSPETGGVTFSGNNTFSGTNTFSNTGTYSGANTFNNTGTYSGNNAFSGSNTHSGPEVFKNLNTIRFADQYTGATADAQIRAACTDLPAAGGTISLLGYGSTAQTLSAAITGCMSSSKQVTFWVDPTTRFNVTESDGNCTFPLDNGSSMVGFGAMPTGTTSTGGGFWLGSSANVSAIVCGAHTDGTQEAAQVKNVGLFGNATATVGKGLVWFSHLATNTLVEDNWFGVCVTACIRLDNIGGWAGIVHNWVNVQDGVTTITGTGVIIHAAGVAGVGIAAITISDNTIEHGSGAGSYEIEVDGDDLGALVGQVWIGRNYLERAPSSGVSIAVRIRDCINCQVQDIQIGGTGTGTTGVQVTQSAANRIGSFTLLNVSMWANAYTNILDDQVSTKTFTQSSFPSLLYYNINAAGGNAPGFSQFNSPTIAGTIPLGRTTTTGSAPTCSVTGAGSTATCSINTGSNDSTGGGIIAATGSGQAASGTLTITYSASLGTNGTTCEILPFNNASSWNARASFIQTNYSTSSNVQGWDNNASALGASGNYYFTYRCSGQ